MILVAKQDVAQTCEVRRDIDAKGAERQSTTLSSSRNGETVATLTGALLSCASASTLRYAATAYATVRWSISFGRCT